MSKRSLGGLALFLALALARPTRAEEPAPPPPAEAPHHKAGPWIVAGIGAGVAAIGILSFVGAVKAHNDVASESAAKGCTTSPDVVCPPGVDPSTLKTNLEGEHAMNVLGVILTASGSAALAAGLYWHFTEPSQRNGRPSVAITPSLGPSYGGLSLVGHF